MTFSAVLARSYPSNSQRDFPGDPVVVQSAVLQNVSPDEQEKALSFERSSDGSRRVDADGSAHQLKPNGVDVLEGGFVGCRSDLDSIHDGELKLLGSLVVYARGCRSSVNERQSRHGCR